jgi:hypothetical protein
MGSGHSCWKCYMMTAALISSSVGFGWILKHNLTGGSYKGKIEENGRRNKEQCHMEFGPAKPWAAS